MKRCKLERRKKHLAYGERFKKGNWCCLCDCHFAPVISKKKERQDARREIRKEIGE